MPGEMDWCFWLLLWAVISLGGTAFAAFFLRCCRDVSGEDRD